MAVRGGGWAVRCFLPLPYQFILLVTQACSFFFQYTSIKNPGAGTFFDGVLPPFPANKLRANVHRSQPQTQLRGAVEPQFPVSAHPKLGSDGSPMSDPRGCASAFSAWMTPPNFCGRQRLSAGYLWPKVDALGNFFTPQLQSTSIRTAAIRQHASPPDANQPQLWLSPRNVL